MHAPAPAACLKRWLGNLVAARQIRSPLSFQKDQVLSGYASAEQIALRALSNVNGNVSRNTYLWLDRERTVSEAAALDREGPRDRPLFAVPASLKDCFDLAGAVTTFGSRFYAETSPPATQDSWMAARLRNAGCILTGKTHLHPLAYGITGENADYGDCLQPRNAGLLTGGSSSGAAASVQEGSALFAIGTDTGGSIRVPAALCGLYGFRTSQRLVERIPELWRGGRHLAPSFDTPGFLLRDARDVAPIASALFAMEPEQISSPIRVGMVPDCFLQDADEAVRTTWPDLCAAFAGLLGTARASLETIPVQGVAERPGAVFASAELVPLYTAIQAYEAAQVHAGKFDDLPPQIAERLRWGASIGADEIARLRRQHNAFQSDFARLWERYDLLVLPCAPMSRLPAATDHSAIRMKTLRYTVPFSLAGVPVLTLPGEALLPGRPDVFGTGIQVASAPLRDSILLSIAMLG